MISRCGVAKHHVTMKTFYIHFDSQKSIFILQQISHDLQSQAINGSTYVRV